MDDLDRVASKKKRKEILTILTSPEPSHYQRLWLVGFLLYCGYSYDAICEIIDKHNQWNDYDKHITRFQVFSVHPRSLKWRSHLPDGWK